jgi:hypothetical protein
MLTTLVLAPSEPAACGGLQMSRSKPVVLMLLPAKDYDPTESAVIWDGLTTAGIDVQFATPDGEPAYADSRLVDEGFSVLSPVLMTKSDSLSAYRRMTGDPLFAKPSAYQAVDLDQIDGLFIPGGHAKGSAPCWNPQRHNRSPCLHSAGTCLSARSATAYSCWLAPSTRPRDSPSCMADAPRRSPSLWS